MVFGEFNDGCGRVIRSGLSSLAFVNPVQVGFSEIKPSVIKLLVINIERRFNPSLPARSVRAEQGIIERKEIHGHVFLVCIFSDAFYGIRQGISSIDSIA